jgi:hypothetical protein
MRTKLGVVIPTIKTADFDLMVRRLASTYLLSPLQIAECAAFSVAMVARFGLGLSALDSYTLCIYDNSLAGNVALTTVRHLSNGGGKVTCIPLEESPLTESLCALDIDCLPVALLEEILPTFHLCVIGVDESNGLSDSLILSLNDARLPILNIGAPPVGKNESLFVNSSIALGAPTEKIIQSIARGTGGRLYVVDISFPQKLFAEFGYEIGFPFADQPVQELVN